MQILFLDESGTAPARNAVDKNPYFVLGGLIVPEAQWKSLQSDLKRLKAEYGVQGEVKWRYFIPHPLSHKTTPLSHLEIPQLDELRIKLFETVAKYKSFRVIAAVVDTHAYYEKHPLRYGMPKICITMRSRLFVHVSSITCRTCSVPLRGHRTTAWS